MNKLLKLFASNESSTIRIECCREALIQLATFSRPPVVDITCIISRILVDDCGQLFSVNREFELVVCAFCQ